MTRTDQGIKASEDFIRKVLADNFKQSVDAETLRAAAQKLCSSLPERQREAA
jgi:hypothetical protein